jgi:DNA-binding MarR family transcriptional regulator
MAKRTDKLRDLERAMQKSVGQLLFKCARLLNERAITEVNREAGAPVLRPSHTNLFPHLDFEGVRLTELARRLGVTKQAVGQLVAELEEMGVVEYKPDPDDGRAKRVRFSARGLEAVRHGLGVLRRLEDELQRKIGKAKMGALRDALIAAVDVLETTAPTED